jgi:hypothetical protein
MTQDTTILAIVGSRDFPDLDQVRQFVRTLPSGTTVVSGGARGVDRCAAAAARSRGLRVIEFLAQWDRFGRRAGFLRNEQIVERCGRMVAFWDGRSSGTHHAITRARALHRPLVIYRLRLAPLIGQVAEKPILETVEGASRTNLSLAVNSTTTDGRPVSKTYEIPVSGALAETLASLKVGRQLRVRAALRQTFFTDPEGRLQHDPVSIEALSIKFLPGSRLLRPAVGTHGEIR